MKKVIFLALIFLSGYVSKAQTSAADRDSVANTTDFQLKVRTASLSAANDLLADTNQPDYVIHYAQLVVTYPQGSWITAMSYGVMNNPAINSGSSQSDIQFTVNSIFVKYAAAYYGVLP